MKLEWLFRLPQSFYPVQTNGYITVNPGDTLAARCVMVNDLDHAVYTGPRDADEMCVYYVMYYVENYGTELTSDQVIWAEVLLGYYWPSDYWKPSYCRNLLSVPY